MCAYVYLLVLGWLVGWLVDCLLFSYAIAYTHTKSQKFYPIREFAHYNSVQTICHHKLHSRFHLVSMSFLSLAMTAHWFLDNILISNELMGSLGFFFHRWDAYNLSGKVSKVPFWLKYTTKMYKRVSKPFDVVIFFREDFQNDFCIRNLFSWSWNWNE